MEYKIIDEFCGVAKALFPHSLERWLWQYCPRKTKQGEFNKYNHQMTNMLYSTSDGYSGLWGDINPLVNAIDNHVEVAAIRRVKANLQLVQPERVYSDFHHDYGNDEGSSDPNMWVAIYYLNTNDGYTELEDGTIIESIEDRILFLPNSIKHRGVSQLSKMERVVINFNFYCPSWTSPL